MTQKTSDRKHIAPAHNDAEMAQALPYSQDPLASASADEVTQRELQRNQGSSYQNYLFGSAGSKENPAWSDSTKGRAAIRLISRGIVGAAFFTVGGKMASNHLKGYDPTKTFSEINPRNWLQYVAKGFDATLGRGIQASVTGISRLKHGAEEAKLIGQRAVTFRESRHFRDSSVSKGRSYGADIVGFTFDFAMASIGDAGTRTIIQAFDPNIKKSWKVNDEGNPAAKGENWHFLPGEWLKSVGKASWRVLSKNQGEDWAAAIPYAFQMKFQRQFLSKVFSKRWDGHQLQFDQSWNGGAYRVNQQGQVVGDYQLVGAIDLHARFVGYNWYTLMFREGYDWAADSLKKWQDNGYSIKLSAPKNVNPVTATLDGIGQSMRYVTKSFIKANMYMNPAVIPFWMMRVPQSKWTGKHFIQDENRSALSTGPQPMQIDTKQSPDPKGYRMNPYGSENYYNYDKNTRFDRFERGFSQALNPLGQFSYWLGGKAGRVGEKLVQHGLLPKNNEVFGKDTASRNGFMRQYVDASLSYTPYMWAKAETALRVDDGGGRDAQGNRLPGQMDKAIYNFMDDVASLNVRNWGKDVKQMWKLGSNFEREVKAREGEDIDALTITKATPKPTTTIQVSTTRHAPAANDARWADRTKPASNDTSWEQKMLANGYNASQIHSSTTTRH